MPSTPDGRFAEVADRVWVARHAYLDVTVTAIGGGRGLLVVDTHASRARGHEVRARLRRLGAGDVVAVVHTHAHFDHVLGTAAFREADPDLPVHAHEVAAAELPGHLAALRAELEADPPTGPAAPLRAEIAETPMVGPDRVFSSVAAVDLGDRLVELAHLGRGHTGGDAVVRVPDADVVIAGDLVEESGPPAYGSDSHPLDWPQTLDLLLGLLADRTVVVPGHGSPVDRAFVTAQREQVGTVAETIRALAAAGVPAADALTRGSWPYPAEGLRHAVLRGYAQLPPGGRSLPLA
jgi:glyoxylase-like metal-dependent hydrolase (beta-lactamase superfamily II)